MTSSHPRRSSLVAPLTIGLLISWCLPSLAATTVESLDARKLITVSTDVLATAKHPYMKWGTLTDIRDALVELYGSGSFQMQWSTEGTPSLRAREVIALFAEAESDGLVPSDYDAALLDEKTTRLEARPTAGEVALYDLALSANLMRYAAAIHRGRIDPQSVGFELEIEDKNLDLAGTVKSLMRAGDLRRSLSTLEPPYPLYKRLKTVLRKYRELDGEDSLDPLPATRGVRLGDSYAGAPQLRRQLIAMGDLPPEAATAPPGTLYNGDIVKGVKRFQDRHGLEPDGIIGRNTLKELNTPIATRIRQIELAMERVRWLPAEKPERVLAVNIPEFKLRALTIQDEGMAADLIMNVVVGQAIDARKTPVFFSDMQYLVMRPFWNVPRSITRREMLPNIRKDPGYLEKHDLEMVARFSAEAKVYPPTPENIARLENGKLKLRQRPGPRNSLGLVKFIFPNAHNVYLHSTPAQELFKKSRRDFSHGCIRVEDPSALAAYVLRDNGGWPPERVDQVMNGPKREQVNLSRRMPVYLLYTTVVVKKSGEVLVFDDIYGHDAHLEDLLEGGYPYLS